ncbi:MAG: ABC transporter ATP-binding protein [Calditrichaeota bacterium]|nr:MAG: ABC transporter ATP-binding protein [Calditrichota bacterium]
MKSEPAIQTRQLTKVYAGRTVVDAVNLHVPRGSIYGYLGANGAGKTTTIRMLLNLHKADSGTIHVLNQPLSAFAAVAPRIGYAPGEIRLYDELTGLETLEYYQGFLSGPAVLRKPLCEALKMSADDLNKKVRYYSQGMKQKLLLIQAMQHDPELLILDEPSERLDPAIQMRLYEWLLGLKKRGRTIFFSSHNLPEVERLCDYIGIIKSGRLIVEEALDALKNRLKHKIRFVFTRPPDVLPEMPEAHWERLASDEAYLHYRGSIAPLWPQLSGLPVQQIDVPESPLEAFFMDYYRREGTVS